MAESNSSSAKVRIGRVFPIGLIRTCPNCSSGDVLWCNISVRPYCNDCKTWGRVNFGSARDAVREWNELLETTEPPMGKLSDHTRWEILHFLDVEMDIATQQMDDPTMRIAILGKIKKYVEGHEYGTEYLVKRYG